MGKREVPDPISDKEYCEGIRDNGLNGKGVAAARVADLIRLKHQTTNPSAIVNGRSVGNYLKFMTMVSEPLVAVNTKVSPHLFSLTPIGEKLVNTQGSTTTEVGENIPIEGKASGTEKPITHPLPHPPDSSGSADDKGSKRRVQPSEEEQRIIEEHDMLFDAIYVAQGLWGFPKDQTKTPGQIQRMTLSQKRAWLVKAKELADAGAKELEAKNVERTELAVKRLAPSILEPLLKEQDERTNKVVDTERKAREEKYRELYEHYKEIRDRPTGSGRLLLLNVVLSVLVAGMTSFIWWSTKTGAGVVVNSPPPPVATAPGTETVQKSADSLDEIQKKIDSL